MLEVAARLHERLAQEGLTASDHVIQRLLAYFGLLQRWNQKINLTSLTNPDEAVDRLLVEPLAAARHLPTGSAVADLGSGGGSPAIPLGLALGASQLLMIESRSRKAAFLREAAREVHLDAIIEAARFEDVARQSRYQGRFHVVSARAVRLDPATLRAAAALLDPQGVLALFQTARALLPGLVVPPNLTWRGTTPLLRSTNSHLALLFHVEHH